ncbi:MAG: ADP-ribosylation/crystallin J1 [Alphaproteobacteria bacterium HGW-Alphaproteobacteria-6]|nr:MAG: ADP-ribosylation/crystallin J1 [Alphaproteobacteria bacterium HGW-Alphaproteobacteria-6]
MELFRPTGLTELHLVRDSGWTAWPPRLPDQPIFYPVTTFAYAEKIARDWNSSQPPPDDLGFVTRFHIDPETARRYPVQLAGGRDHRELWVPADGLVAFNSGIVGKIDVIAGFRARAPLSEEELADFRD